LTKVSRSIHNLFTDKLNTKKCPFREEISCNATTKYQNFDGSCNNFYIPYYGKAETPYVRLLDAEYDDVTNSPRTKNLPNPRLISRNLNNDNSQTTGVCTHIWAVFSQCLTHDITRTSITNNHGSEPSCSSCTEKSDDYISIPIFGDDPMRVTCLPFVRSSAPFSLDCSSSQRQQLNLVTSFIDASNVYESSKNASDSLTFSNEELLTSDVIKEKRPYPPKAKAVCSLDTTDKTLKCFNGGDAQVSENLGLTKIHSLFVREHNRIAQKLAKVNTDWDDE